MPSIDFDMEDNDDDDELTQPHQEIDMEVESEDLKHRLLPLRTLMEVDTEMPGESEITAFSLTKHRSADE